MKYKTEEFIDKVTDKLMESERSYKKLYPQRIDVRNRMKFISVTLLDYFLTQISPSELAEYMDERGKGYV